MASTYEDYEAVSQHCLATVLPEAPVFFMARWSVTNLFHFMEDLVTMFLSLILLEVRSCSIAA